MPLFRYSPMACEIRNYRKATLGSKHAWLKAAKGQQRRKAIASALEAYF